MKCLIILMSILLLVFCSFGSAFAGTEQKSSEPAAKEEGPTQVEKPAQKGDTDANEVADANAVTDANEVADANAVEAEARVFEELEKPLEDINEKSKKEIRAWMRRAAEDKISLAKAVQKQVTAELNFLRELAVEEGAVKTTEAIDRLLASRQERFEEIIEKMEKRKARLTEREERRRKDREDRRTRERPSRRNARD